MSKKISVTLRRNRPAGEDDIVIETDYDTVAEAGVIEHNGEYYTYQRMEGSFFGKPIFQRVKKVSL